MRVQSGKKAAPQNLRWSAKPLILNGFRIASYAYAVNGGKATPGLI
jgi:hypothetical protein